MTYIDFCQGVAVVLIFAGVAWVGDRVAQVVLWWQRRKAVR